MKTISLSSFLSLILGFTILTAEMSPSDTVITSDRLEMQGTENKNYFTFENQVEVRGTNLKIDCDKLTVVSQRSGNSSEGMGEIGAIETILAEGNVMIEQAGRIAYAGKAEVDPNKGIVILSDSPKIVDDDVTVEGYQFVLHRGEKKFESIPDPNAGSDGGRSKVKLGALPDLGFDKTEENITNKPEKIELKNSQGEGFAE